MQEPPAAKRRRTVAPLPPMGQPSDVAPRATSSPLPPPEGQDESFVLNLTPVTSDAPVCMDGPQEEEVVEEEQEEQRVVPSPSEYSLPDEESVAHGNVGEEEARLEPAVAQNPALAFLFERMAVLEQTVRLPSDHDATLMETRKRHADAAETQAAALTTIAQSMQGLRQDIQKNEKARATDARRQRLLTRANIAAVSALKSAFLQHTEQHRLSLEKVTNAVLEHTVATRQMNSAEPMPELIAPSSSNTPSRSSNTSPSCSPPQHHGLRRQRGGRKGRK